MRYVTVVGAALAVCLGVILGVSSVIAVGVAVKFVGAFFGLSEEVAGETGFAATITAIFALAFIMPLAIKVLVRDWRSDGI